MRPPEVMALVIDSGKGPLTLDLISEAFTRMFRFIPHTVASSTQGGGVLGIGIGGFGGEFGGGAGGGVGGGAG